MEQRHEPFIPRARREPPACLEVDARLLPVSKREAGGAQVNLENEAAGVSLVELQKAKKQGTPLGVSQQGCIV
jgi:hypothetical protein